MTASSDSLRVVLLSPRNPLNIGAAARAMSNFGFTRLRVVNAYNIAYQEAKSAVNASAILDSSEQYHTVGDAVKDCMLVVGTTSVGHRDLQHPLRRLERGGELIRESLAAGPVALLFGSEKFGLTNDEMAHCHWLMRIPTRAEHESMNLGQAVALCLYELIRDQRAAGIEPIAHKAAAAEELQRITDLLIEAARRSGYMNPTTSASTENKLRRMVNRLQLTERDAHVWLGVLRQILWKFDAGPQMLS
jgi:TrmH family RNA methyltransferase